MTEYKSDLTVIKRLVENSEEKLFPRMKKRKQYLDNLVEDNKEVPPALKAEIEINDNIRQHIQLMMNYVIYMESFIDKNINGLPQSENTYIQALENELLHDFRSKHNFSK